MINDNIILQVAEEKLHKNKRTYSVSTHLLDVVPDAEARSLELLGHAIHQRLVRPAVRDHNHAVRGYCLFAGLMGVLVM